MLRYISVSLLAMLAIQSIAQVQSDSIRTISAENTDTMVHEHTVPAEILNQTADSAYSADNFSLAEALYLKSVDMNGTSPEIYYNLGNTYYRQGNLGKAVLYYERSLKLDPTNADARANLEFVKSKIVDKETSDASLVSRLWENVVLQFKADTWAAIALVLFSIFLAGILTYLFSESIMIRKISFFGGLGVFLLCIVSVIISFSAANRMTTNKYAIILPPSVQLSTTPRDARNQTEEAFLLHEGTKVVIVDSISSQSGGKWYEVLVGNQDRAWLKASEVERI